MKKLKTKIILSFVAIFALTILSGCSFGVWQSPGEKEEKDGQQELLLQKAPKKSESTSNKDEIDFSDPGDDALGKEIKEMDKLINQTSPSEYSEEALSDEAICTEAEIQ